MLRCRSPIFPCTPCSSMLDSATPECASWAVRFVVRQGFK
jgi:hypothetical protein